MGGGENFFFGGGVFPTKNVPGVLKRMQNLFIFSEGGGDFGVFGAPHSPGGRAGSEKDTLLPMTMMVCLLEFNVSLSQ